MNSLSHKIYNPWLIAVVVSLATFMEVLDTTITNVSLSHIAGAMGATPDESTWVLTSYLIANGIVLPLSGWLSGVMGQKKFFMTCVAGFTVASFACGAATSLWEIILFRVIQGFAGGGLQPTQQAIILDAFPPEKRGAVFGITGLTMIVAPILGPTLGGYITDNLNWRWIFFINVPVGLIALFLVNKMVQDPPHAKSKGLFSIDYIGIGLIVLCFGTLQLILDKGQQQDWFDSKFIIMLASICITSLFAAIIWLLYKEDPIIDLRLLKLKSFGLSCIMIFFTGFVLYSSSALLPILVQSQFGYDATLAGLILSPGGLAIIFIMPIAGKLVNFVQAKYLVAVGMALCAFGMWNAAHISPQADYLTFVMVRISQVIGLPFLFIPNSVIAFQDIPKEKNNRASSLFAMSRNLGGSIGIALVTSYVIRHEQIRQAYLVNNLSQTNGIYKTAFNRSLQIFLAKGFNLYDATLAVMGKTYHELIHQATVLAYNDTFLLLSNLMLLLSFVALFLMPSNKKHKGSKDIPEPVH